MNYVAIKYGDHLPEIVVHKNSSLGQNAINFDKHVRKHYKNHKYRDLHRVEYRELMNWAILYLTDILMAEKAYSRQSRTASDFMVKESEYSSEPVLFTTAEREMYAEAIQAASNTWNTPEAADKLLASKNSFRMNKGRNGRNGPAGVFEKLASGVFQNEFAAQVGAVLADTI